jgi:hypothetical protein
MQHEQPSMPEYLDGENSFYQEPGADFMRDPNIINSRFGVPTVEALVRKFTGNVDEETWM